MEDKLHLQLQIVSYFADQGQNKHSEDRKNLQPWQGDLWPLVYQNTRVKYLHGVLRSFAISGPF